MADLFIDFAALSRVRHDMDGISDLLSRPVDAMRTRAAGATGHDGLRQRLQEFGDDWDYGIKQLGKYSAGCSEALENIRTQFEKLDQELASAFEDQA
ncbi:hypothetical protein [Nocardioides pantholopis]|uniref:hypothetical protein n=1 Tax=Nocardioides pantholopis TaxID=2483798 RepID=UPI000F097A9C|nr:hypothetical protein [Nocardioides pantholopis]